MKSKIISMINSIFRTAQVWQPVCRLKKLFIFLLHLLLFEFEIGLVKSFLHPIFLEKIQLEKALKNMEFACFRNIKTNIKVFVVQYTGSCSIFCCDSKTEEKRNSGCQRYIPCQNEQYQLKTDVQGSLFEKLR